LRKATLVRHVSLSGKKNKIKQIGSYWMDFYEILYLKIFLKICRENSILIKILQE